MSEQFNRAWQAVQNLRDTQKCALMLFLIGKYLRDEGEYVSFTHPTIPVCFVGVLADARNGMDLLLQIEEYLSDSNNFPVSSRALAIAQFDRLLEQYLADDESDGME